MSKSTASQATVAPVASTDFAEAVSDLGSVTSHAASEVKDALRDAASHFGEAARQAATSAAENLDPDALKAAVAKYTREHPLIVVGAAFAAGFLVSRALR